MSKTLIVIRHGESEWNATPRPDREQWYFKQLEAAEQEAHNNKLLGCRLRDARMTAKGRAQCDELRNLLVKLEAVKHLKPELVVVSPLSRAMETASIVFPDSAEVPIKLYPGMQEFVVNICDVGRPLSELKQEFPKLDFSHMQDDWWSVPMAKETPQSLQNRIAILHSYLRSLPQKVIVLVGHGHFLRELLKGTPCESAYMRNTEFRILELPVAEKEFMVKMDSAIVVCGLKIQLDDPSLQILAERVSLAKKLYYEQNTNKTSNSTNNTIVIMAGGPTSTQVLTAEGSIMKVLAAKSGIPVEKIFVEDRSLDTIENAVYAKTIIDTKFPNIKKIIVVTSDYHQQRALMVFQRVFGENFSFEVHGASSTTSLPSDTRAKHEESEKHYISILDDLFTKKRAKMEGEEAAKYLPPKLSISLKDKEAGGNKKFYGNGQFKHFPGNTTVCMVPRHSKQFQLLVQAQQLIRQSPLCDHYALLPPSSFHMTVHDLNSHTPEGLNILEINQFWKENHRKMQTILAPLLESCDWTIFRMNFASMTPKGNLLNLVPSSLRTERALASWRANLQTRLYGKPVVSNYGFHITLAYLLHPITTPEGNIELNKLIQQLTHHFSSFGEVELEPPRLTRFHDMSEYLPMLGTMDTGLLLCYDIATGNGCFANCYEYGSGLELRALKWSQGWSQFVPFVFENETYYIAYKHTTGRLHIVNAKSVHVAIDIITLVYKPGFTHVVYVFHNNEPLVVLYNYNSNDLCILKIDFAKLGFAPYITTTLSPGGFTHLIECNSFLLAYSGVTGDMVAFQIQPSGKRVVSAAYAPLARGITSITSLSSGFGIHNSTPGRFFAYEAGTGKSFVFGFSSDRFSSSMETTLEVGLSIVIPVRLGDSDFIYAYRAQTGALQIYKGVSNGRSIVFSLFARHSLPPALTNLIFLDRRM